MVTNVSVMCVTVVLDVLGVVFVFIMVDTQDVFGVLGCYALR